MQDPDYQPPASIAELKNVIEELCGAHTKAKADLKAGVERRGIQTEHQLKLFLQHDDELKELAGIEALLKIGIREARRDLRTFRKRHR